MPLKTLPTCQGDIEVPDGLQNRLLNKQPTVSPGTIQGLNSAKAQSASETRTCMPPKLMGANNPVAAIYNAATMAASARALMLFPFFIPSHSYDLIITYTPWELRGFSSWLVL